MATNDLKTYPDTLTLAELATVYNQVSDRSIKKFSDKPTATIRTQAALEKARKMVVRRADGSLRVVSEKTEKKVVDKRKRKFPNDHVIRVLAESNPKRKGSKSEARFALYTDGMTVQQYKDACTSMEDAFMRATDDLGYDTQHGFIRVEPAS